MYSIAHGNHSWPSRADQHYLMEVTMKKLMLFAVLGAFTPMAFAEAVTFSEADTNEDGALSTSEAKIALPDVLIIDNNNDGMLNPSEAEVAVPGLMLSVDKDKTKALVGPREYESILKAIAQLNGESTDVSKS